MVAPQGRQHDPVAIPAPARPRPARRPGHESRSYSSHSPLTTRHCAVLIDTRCYSETIVSSTKERIGDTSNRHTISRVRIYAGRCRALAGTLESSGPRPSAAVGCVKMASRRRVNGRPPSMAVWTAAIISLASTPRAVKPGCGRFARRSALSRNRGFRRWRRLEGRRPWAAWRDDRRCRVSWLRFR